MTISILFRVFYFVTDGAVNRQWLTASGYPNHDGFLVDSIKYMNIDKVAEPGHTILWDLLQDNLAVSLLNYR